MLGFYAIPDGLLPNEWVPTQEGIDYLIPGISLIDTIELSDDAEDAEMIAAAATPLAPAVPKVGGLIAKPAAAIVGRDQQISLLGAIAAGPWRSVINDSLIDHLETALQAAFGQNDTLLVLRT